MKKIAVLIALLLIGFATQAQSARNIRSHKNDVCFVKTGDHVYFGQDLKIGFFRTKIVSTDGTVAKIDNKDVKAYMHDGKLIELLPVICSRGDTVCLKFMEYVTSKSGMKLYQYYCMQDKNNPRYIYFIFKDDKFYSRIDDLKSAKEVLPQFGIDVKVQNLGLAFL